MAEQCQKVSQNQFCTMMLSKLIQTRESIEKILPNFYEKYNPNNRVNFEKYQKLVKDRFKQRQQFLKSTDLSAKPKILNNLINALEITA